MHVLIDGRMLIGRFSGIGRFVTRLVDALSRRDGVEVSLLCGSSDGGGACGRDPLNGADRELRARLQQQGVGIETCSFSRRDRTALRRLIWEERNLPRVIARSGADVFHATWNSGVPIRCPVPAVLTIHDLIPWHAPRDHFYYRHDRWAYRSGVRWSARRARVITAVSEYSRAALVSTLGIDGSKTVTIHNGVDSRSLPRDEVLARPNQPYVLYVGGHQDRKNVAGVLRAMACYWSRHGESLELHLTGDEDSLCPTARTALSDIRGAGRIRFLGQVDDSTLSSAYRGASALLMLSRDEGFGLPVLEAMAHGCPVISSRSSALPEVVGDAGVLVDAGDAREASNALASVMQDDELRESLVRRGRKRAAGMGWDAVSQQMVGVYDGVLRTV